MFYLQYTSTPVGRQDRSCQYSRKGHSTTDVPLYMLQAIYEGVDTGEASAQIFFADFTKRFDLIDHPILIEKLADLENHLACVAGGISRASAFVLVAKL